MDLQGTTPFLNGPANQMPALSFDVSSRQLSLWSLPHFALPKRRPVSWLNIGSQFHWLLLRLHYLLIKNYNALEKVVTHKY